MKEYVGGKVLETGYHYDDQSNHSYKTGLFRGIFLNGQRQIAYSYDDMSRRDKRVVMTTVPFVTEYTYYDGATSGTTSPVVKTLKNGSTTWEYAYDAVGNITSIKENGTVVESYGYDALNQLTTVVRGADTYSYSYDASGNITAVTKNGGSYKSYSYGNSNWKDLLTAYNGTTITYDAIGNPLTYRDGFTFTWSNGRQLATAAKGGNTYTYTYDASGLRTSKTVGNTTTQYYWLGDKLQAQRTGNDYLIFLYDEASIPYGLIHKYGSTEITYYYEYNLQGDIIGIINDAGTRVVTYQYSAWGELLSTSGSMASNIGASNPLRYRGYYYDQETGFYYLQSRYYDPITGRFLNADVLLSTGQGVLGYNMFAYCNNNPVLFMDSLGLRARLNIKMAIDGGIGSLHQKENDGNIIKKMLDSMTDSRDTGNTFSVGITYGYNNGGAIIGKSAVLSADTSHNYALQETTTFGGGIGFGGSLGITMSYTNATNVQDLSGVSDSYGFTIVGALGISVDYISFVPASNPNTTCWGITVAISLGSEMDAHMGQNYTTSSNSWNPLVKLRDFLFGGK